MKVFKVQAKMSSYSYIYVKAKDAESARDIADNIDGGEFISDDNPYSGSWEMTDVDELSKSEIQSLKNDIHE